MAKKDKESKKSKWVTGRIIFINLRKTSIFSESGGEAIS